jgi:hypothetical protein
MPPALSSIVVGYFSDRVMHFAQVSLIPGFYYLYLLYNWDNRHTTPYLAYLLRWGGSGFWPGSPQTTIYCA